MPFCEPCDRFYNPNTIHEDGTCPECGEAIAEPHQLVRPKLDPGLERDGAPWHFWLMVAAVMIYLIWRAVQGVDWLFG